MYSIVISDGFQLSVYSALSEDQSANFLTFWLSEFLKTYGRIPKLFVCDMSFAIINAAVRAFGQNSSISEYLDIIFRIANRKNNPIQINRQHLNLIKPPHCMIRIDFAHLMNLIKKNKALNSPGTWKKVKDFYMRCITILIQTKTLEFAKNQIYSVLIVAKSKTEGISASSGDEVPCELHKRSIINTIIEGFDESENTEKAPEESDEYNTEIEYLQQLSSPFQTWLDEIVKSAEETVASADDGDRDNVMYKPVFAKDFIRICKILPLWSGISCDVFQIDEVTSSSGNVESDFKNVKQFLEDIIPCSADIFVQEHIEMLKGATIEASQTSNYVKFIGNRNEKTGKSHVEQDECEHQNNTVDQQNVNEKQTKEKVDESSEHSITPITGCADGGEPGGAHHCIQCDKAVHILPCCSISIGDDEGYGEKRLCNACVARNKLQTSSQIATSGSQAISEMQYTEDWNKTKKKTTSKYMKPAPNWNLNTNIQEKVKIAIMQNGNLMTTTYDVGSDEKLGLANTCTFDSVSQVITFSEYIHYLN